MIRLAVADCFPADADQTLRAAAAASLLTAVNLAFRTSGARGCTIDSCTLTPSEDGARTILTMIAVPGDKPATLDDVRALLRAGKQEK